MPVGLNPNYIKSSTRQKLVHGPAVFNNKGQIILVSNNLGNLFKNFKTKDQTRIKELLKSINAKYYNNVNKMVKNVKKARGYRLSNGNLKHKYIYEYWKWLTSVVPLIMYGKTPNFYKRNPLSTIQVKTPGTTF